MIIEKILNNNVVLTLTENQEEMVVMGRGLAFSKKVGDEIDPVYIEKTFVMEGKEVTAQLAELFVEIPPEEIEVANEVIKLAQDEIDTKLSNNIYLTLTDHIHFAITRTREGLEIKNPLIWEIRKFYQKEYQIGLQAVDIIHKKLGVQLSNDEAAIIALHIVNAIQGDYDMSNTYQITKIVQDILNIVRLHFGLVYNESSLNYTRFVTHLQYFAQRMLNEEIPNTGDDFLYEQVQLKYKKAFECSIKINDYLKKAHYKELSIDEQVYLTIHIHRVAEN
ncbi:BglG family transcription antiterminator LicT [Carnobacterium gallinarum]|uniref:BglG family transcription antiterminator LicT n=1 Tax=Carnobacterium gallinarum TaxID=2749 RepID=UPI000553E86B|nr:PRD domain-containing protein [Carnobacterium gallinarum]